MKTAARAGTFADVLHGIATIALSNPAIGQFGKDVEVARLVAYSCQPRNRFITGAALTVAVGGCRA
ncbi:MAG: hypothetical protein V4564_04465 [Pseudomonadota bacterium]